VQVQVCRVKMLGPDLPFSPTAVNNHSGESNEPGASCELVPDEDEACVNKQLVLGTRHGPFFPGINDCKTFALNVLNTCRQSQRVFPNLPVYTYSY
jgi:hypothetical protein